MPVQSVPRMLAAVLTLGALAVLPAVPASASTPGVPVCVTREPCYLPAPEPAWSGTAQALEARRAREIARAHRPGAAQTPRPTKVAPDTRFQWDDAGIGAATALAIMLGGLAAALTQRRHVRHVRLAA